MNADEWFGPFAISRVKSRGVHVGWGIVCNRHHDVDPGYTVTGCKKQIAQGSYTDRQCKALLKQWLLEGFGIEPLAPLARRKHVHDVKIHE